MSQETAPTAPAAPSIPAATGPRAMRSAGAWLLLAIVTTLGLAADLGTKAWAFRTVAGVPIVVERETVLAIAESNPHDIGRGIIPRHDPVVVIPSVLHFTLVLNPGAVFGIGAGQRWFFVVFTAIAMTVALCVFAFATRARDRWTHAAIGLLLAGGLGNVYDRLVYGCVRDFIHPLPGVKFPFGWSPFGDNGEVWPYVSNVADALLIVGIGILAIRLWKHEPRKPDAAAATPATPAQPSVPAA